MTNDVSLVAINKTFEKPGIACDYRNKRKMCEKFSSLNDVQQHKFMRLHSYLFRLRREIHEKHASLKTRFNNLRETDIRAGAVNAQGELNNN